MSLIRCPSCGHDNAAHSKYCSDCGGALHLPPHLVACPRCGSINPAKGAACIWCNAKLPGPLQRSLRARPTRVVVAAMAFAVVAVLGYYAYPGDLPVGGPRSPAARELVGPAASQEAAPLAEPPRATPDTQRAGRGPAEAPATKAAAAARPQASSARKAAVAEACTEARAALGLCGKTEAQEPTRPQTCTEAVAALGLCASQATQRRE